ncbi:MAG: competence/damage-inducible protein A [Rhodothermales bacterium]
MTASIITIGDEILIGQIVNTNAAWLGEQCTSLGMDVVSMVTVGDAESAIRSALRNAMQTSQLVLMTGGLGPTHDDITKHAVAAEFGDALIENPDVLAAVRERFTRRNLVMVEANRSQALIPESFRAVINPVGTAPGMLRRYSCDGGEGLLAVLPGVPHEMKALVQSHVVEEIGRMGGQQSIVQRTLLTTGIGESNLEHHLEGVHDHLKDGVSLAWLPSIHGVRIRVTGRAADTRKARARVDELVGWIQARAGRYIYGEDLQTLEEVVGTMVHACGWTIATAESCTGGLVSHRLTNIPGSSGYVLGGVVSYGNAVKEGQLGVNAHDLALHGAVSEPVARQMAEGVREALGADVGLATTGIMGPGGGSDEKPVGTVWVGVALPDSTTAVRFQLGTDRLRNKDRAATAALNALRLYLLENGCG